MEFWVLFTIFCLVCAAVYVQKNLRNGGGRVSLRPWKKRHFRKCVKELRKSIDEFSSDCGSMKISQKQCQILRSECLRLVEPYQPHFILKELFCAMRRALKLMQDCCSNNWLLKAVEFGNCQEHFLEILLDLHRLPIVVDLVGFVGESPDDIASKFKSIDIREKIKLRIRDARESDMEALSSRLESEIGHNLDHPDHYLADQLKANPSSIAPTHIRRYVTQFDILKSPCIYRGFGHIFVCPVTFRSKEFVIKMRFTKDVEDFKDTRLRREATFMKKCRHPYAVGLLGYWEARRTDGRKVPLLLMESMECDLKSIIGRNRRWWWGSTGGFSALDTISLVLPVAKVMKYLHSIGVVHRDLKPQNILFARVPWTHLLPEDVSVKLADFGEAQNAKGGTIVRAGTPGYTDPDVWDRNQSVDLFSADVFSFGLVVGEVLTGLSPAEALDCMLDWDDGPCVNVKKFNEKLRQGGLPLPKETHKYLKSIVESCLKPIPGERPSFEDICWQLRSAEFLLLN